MGAAPNTTTGNCDGGGQQDNGQQHHAQRLPRLDAIRGGQGSHFQLGAQYGRSGSGTGRSPRPRLAPISSGRSCTSSTATRPTTLATILADSVFYNEKRLRLHHRWARIIPGPIHKDKQKTYFMVGRSAQGQSPGKPTLSAPVPTAQSEEALTDVCQRQARIGGARAILQSNAPIKPVSLSGLGGAAGTFADMFPNNASQPLPVTKTVCHGALLALNQHPIDGTSTYLAAPNPYPPMAGKELIRGGP